MRKIVINRCYGGFGLSPDAEIAIANRKGFDIKFNCPIENIKNDLFVYSDLPEYTRDDIDVIAVVEQLGSKASGQCARLVIVEIPEDVSWTIEEYDGVEWVSEKHRTWGEDE